MTRGGYSILNPPDWWLLRHDANGITPPTKASQQSPWSTRYPTSSDCQSFCRMKSFFLLTISYFICIRRYKHIEHYPIPPCEKASGSCLKWHWMAGFPYLAGSIGKASITPRPGVSRRSQFHHPSDRKAHRLGRQSLCPESQCVGHAISCPNPKRLFFVLLEP